MPPAATLTSMQACPMISPGVPPVPHGGGPIMGPGVPNVVLQGKPASVVGDQATCVGPPTKIVTGCAKVVVGGKPLTVVSLSQTSHGGVVSGPGALNVEIGG